VVDRRYEAARHALADATVLERLNALGAIPLGTDPEVFARFLAEQRAAMARLVREAGIRVN
jgi:tripartite-type tricarboxylate transporter receptor subunit TctC